MQPNVPDDKIKSAKQFVHWSDELTDSEAQGAVKVIAQIQQKYAPMANTKENLEALRDEALTRLMDLGIVAELDPAPCFYGEPPILEIRGKVSTDPIHKHGFDHEQKQYEVLKAMERNEDYLGQKEQPNKRKKKDGS